MKRFSPLRLSVIVFVVNFISRQEKIYPFPCIGNGSELYFFLDECRYYSNRLIFYRDIIEPLGDNDIFECITPEGTFAMSKKDFYRVFSNVANNVTCYIRDGKYSYSKTPEKARQFLIKD